MEQKRAELIAAGIIQDTQDDEEDKEQKHSHAIKTRKKKNDKGKK